jgi:hypothetical protein
MMTGSLVPDTMIVHLKYSDVVLLTNLAGTGVYTFSLNGMYDVDITGTGHQPLGFDQWSAFYTSYQVFSSSIRVQVLPPDTNIALCTVYPSVSSSPITDASDAREQPYSAFRWVVNPSTGGYSIINNAIAVRKLEGRGTQSVNYVANTNANPTSQRYWHVVLTSPSGTSIGDIYLDVKIIFHAKFFRRTIISPSLQPPKLASKPILVCMPKSQDQKDEEEEDLVFG